MKFDRIGIIYRKEIRDILRDKRTLISMVLIPILIFPLMTGGIGGLVGSQIQKMGQQKTAIIVLGEEHAPDLYNYLTANESLILLETANDSTSAVRLLNDGVVQAVIQIPEGFESGFGDFFSGTDSSDYLNLIIDESEVKSDISRDKVVNILKDYRSKVVGEELKRNNLREDFDRPFWIYTHNTATESEMGGFVAGMIMPYMVILLALVGAMYPAIDLTAGEKERGTMETLLISPVARTDIVYGKFLTIMTASMATSILSMLSMYITLSSGFFLAGESSEVGFSIEPTGLFWILLMMLPLSALFSSLLMTVALFARSYREAQSYISPMMIFAIIPAVASVIPGIELNLKLAIVPIINVTLVLKDALMGRYDTVMILAVFISNIIYARIGIYIAAKQFQREEVLFRI